MGEVLGGETRGDVGFLDSPFASLKETKGSFGEEGVRHWGFDGEEERRGREGVDGEDRGEEQRKETGVVVVVVERMKDM